MAGRETSTVSLPTPLLDRLDRFIEGNPSLGITSRPELIKQALVLYWTNHRMHLVEEEER